MIHSAAYLAGPAIATMALREAGALARRLLAYRHQLRLIELATRPGGRGCSVDCAGPDQISIRPAAVPTDTAAS